MKYKKDCSLFKDQEAVLQHLNMGLHLTAIPRQEHELLNFQPGAVKPHSSIGANIQKAGITANIIT